MSTYTATVRWERREGEAFTDKRYSRAHRWEFDGGAVGDGREHGLGIGQEAAPRLGQDDAALHPLEERRAQLVLEEAEPPADRRLRAVQRVGGSPEPAEPRDGDEGGDLVDVHDSSASLMVWLR